MFGSKRGFTSHQGIVELRLDSQEATVLRDLFAQVSTLVEPSEPADSDPLGRLLDLSEAERPSDPAILRLFPDGYTDDVEASAEFRRFTERGLREAKSTRVAVTMEVLGRVPDAKKPQPVELTSAEANAFLGSLNDLRLVLGARLGIVADDQDVSRGWSEDDPRTVTYGAYQWLTWLQAELLEAVDESGAG